MLVDDDSGVESAVASNSLDVQQPYVTALRLSIGDCGLSDLPKFQARYFVRVLPWGKQCRTLGRYQPNGLADENG
jgi:hypothetical protein